MKPENFAEWLRRQGYFVIRTASSYWYEASPRVFQAFPFHWMIRPGELEILKFLSDNRAIALRYSTPIESNIGLISYHTVYDKPSYTLDDLDRRSRQNIRKGLKNCKVEAISVERYAQEGWLLEKDTAERQGRKIALSEKDWHNRYMAAVNIPGFEAWGALVDGRLAASLFTFKTLDCCELITQQCHRNYINKRVNNALSFVVTKKMLNRTGIRSVFYSLQSLNAPESVDKFKFRMGYAPKPVRQRVVFNSLLSPFINKASFSIVKWIAGNRPNNSFLSKMSGMLRFYLKGKCAPGSQRWPECLLKKKNELLKLIESKNGIAQ
jgi:hypothetical protein